MASRPATVLCLARKVKHRKKMGYSSDPENLRGILGHVGPSQRRAIEYGNTSQGKTHPGLELAGTRRIHQRLCGDAYQGSTLVRQALQDHS